MRGLSVYENADMKEKCQKEGREDQGRKKTVDILFLALTLVFPLPCLPARGFGFRYP